LLCLDYSKPDSVVWTTKKAMICVYVVDVPVLGASAWRHAKFAGAGSGANPEPPPPHVGTQVIFIHATVSSTTLLPCCKVGGGLYLFNITDLETNAQ